MTFVQVGELTYLVKGLESPLAFAAALNLNPPDALEEAVPSFETLGLFLRRPEPEEVVREWIAVCSKMTAIEPRSVTIPCRYDGPDIEEVCSILRISREALVVLHSSREYRCYALGFSPGFAYLGYLEEALFLPRRGEPRAQVPAGSVAIAGRQTAVYPEATPGGWWLIGTTDAPIVDLGRGFFAIHPGDLVRFEPIALP